MTELNFNIDAKGRVSLGKLLPEGATMLKGYYDETREEIVLKPYIEVPLSTWLMNNPKSLISLKHGIQDIKKGKAKRYSNVDELLEELDK